MNTYLHNYTYTQQSRLADYCRTGKLNSIDGLTENRVHHYRELVYNIVDDTLQSAFPLTFDLLSEDEWNEIVHYFFSTHKCQSNSIWRTPHEFYLFIEGNDLEIKKKYNFIEELLLFEWTEIDIYMMPDVQYPEYKSTGGWLSEIITVNPEHKILQLSWPVHLKNPNDITGDDKSEYYVLIFREKESGKVQFINLSVYFAWLIEKIEIEKKSLVKILKEAESLFGIEVKKLFENTIPFLEELNNKQFILGFRK